ncbi:MAG: bifunctional DNA primase/polymerase, partial [Acidobacteriota bacterium]|nr:bifunctional DNA primase/polymerase [Acidobacteriota bacterium]
GIGKPGPNGFTAFHEFWKQHVSELPEHLIVQSGSMGEHHYFFLPLDLSRDGPLRGGPFRTGIDLLTCGKNVILPGSCVASPFGSGSYTVISGTGVGIPEMPWPLAEALIKLRPTIPPETSKRPKAKKASEPPSFDSGLNPAIASDVQRKLDLMLTRNDYFPRFWNLEPNPGHDESPSGYIYNIVKVAIKFGCDECMTRTIVELFCSRHGFPFKEKPLATTYRKICSEFSLGTTPVNGLGVEGSKGGGGRSENIKVNIYPPDVASEMAFERQWLPLPVRPSDTKIAKFESYPKAVKAFGPLPA